MRNPLSAIMLCADGIASSVADFQSSVDLSSLELLLENNLDAAQTYVQYLLYWPSSLGSCAS